MVNKNKFITFEGIDGSGKTTQSKKLHHYLKGKSIWTREPGGTQIAEDIRNIVLNNNLDKYSDLFLIMAARIDHINNVIKPSLNHGNFVISDRYIDSTIVYQSSDEILPADDILSLHTQYINFMPSMTFYIDIDYDTAKDRIDKRENNNKYDNLNRTTFDKLSYHYKTLSQKFSNRIITIDGNQTEDRVYEQIKTKFDKFYSF